MWVWHVGVKCCDEMSVCVYSTILTYLSLSIITYPGLTKSVLLQLAQFLHTWGYVYQFWGNSINIKFWSLVKIHFNFVRVCRIILVYVEQEICIFGLWDWFCQNSFCICDQVWQKGSYCPWQELQLNTKLHKSTIRFQCQT